jgi:hypothetical protein
MQQEQALHAFERTVLASIMTQDQWPENLVFYTHGSKRRLKLSFLDLMEKVVKMKVLAQRLSMSGEMNEGADSHRGCITAQLQQLTKDLIEATAVTELSQMFSTDAQSTLI